jgi:hypothetical protein
VVDIQVIALGEGVNVDYVVDSTGMGTHLLLFGTTGALEAAIATGGDRTIWVCTSHSETVEAKHDITELAEQQRIVVFSGGRNRPVINCDDTLSTNPFIDHQSANSHINSTLIFKGVAFARSSGDGASAGPFFQGNGGYILPRMEFYDVAFEGDNWTYLFDLDTGSSANVSDLVLDKVHTREAITALFAVASNMATVGKLTIRDCDFAALTNIQERDASTDVDLGRDGILIENNLFRSVTGYGWTRTHNYPFVFSNNDVLNYSGTASFLSIGTAGTTSPVDATVDGNYIRCSTDNNGTRAITITGGGGTAKNISIVGNALRGPTGSNTHVAVAIDLANTDCLILNSYRDWDTNVGGTVGPTGTGGDHGGLGGLGDDDHTLYLLADGTRELTGNWDVGAFTITAKQLLIDSTLHLFLNPGSSTNYGNTGIGGSTFNVSAQQQDARKVTLVGGNYTSLSVYGSLNTSTRQIKLVIYDDDGGAPGNLVAYTADITVSASGSPDWWSGDIAFNAAAGAISDIDLAGGDYWIAVMSRGGGGFTFTWYYDGSGTSHDANPTTWNGPEDPWSGGSGGSRDLSIYITGTPVSPRLTFDTNDYQEYNRGSNYYSWVIGSTEYMRLNGTKLDLLNGAYLDAADVRLLVVAKSGAYTLTAEDGLVLADASGGTFTLTLPTAVGITGRMYRVKKTDATANAVTIDANAAETIDGGATATLLVQYEAITVVSDGTEWWVV